MNWRTLFGRKVEKRSQDPYTALWRDRSRSGVGSQGAEGIPTVFACIQLISEGAFKFAVECLPATAGRWPRGRCFPSAAPCPAQ